MARALIPLLRATVLAGLLGGVAASIFHLVVAEPLIERAIAVEEQRSRASGAPPEQPVVSRPMQKVGLVVGLLVYGAVWGLLFGVAYRHLEPHVPAASARARGAWVAALVGWSVALFPFLKYPANPPGVGDADTIAARQSLYLAFIALSVLGIWLAVTVRRFFPGRWPLLIGVYAVYLALIYALVPGSLDTVDMPAGLLWAFRVVSFLGLALFWAVLAIAFARLTPEGTRHAG